MSERTSTRRRLDLTSSNNVSNPPKKVVNPYAKATKTQLPTTSKDNDTKPENKPTVTPVDSFFIKKKPFDSTTKPKPHAARQILTGDQNESSIGQKRKQPESDEDDENYELYYHSGEDEKNSKSLYKPDRIHSSLDYRHRGELALGEGTLKAYRFVRNNFLIPRDIESNPKFGPHSGTCFEERVLRAYSLGQLKAKGKNLGEDASSLAVCTFCGKEGHRRDSCMDLL